jgi:predicted ATPase/class 3 adenylate cyclase
LQTRVVSRFAPYLPRLIRDWPGGSFLELEGTLVSLDISGFTRLSERLQAKGRAGAEELVLAVSGVFHGLIGIAEQHDGDVLKFRGDALLLLFHGPSHERRASLAASHMQWLIGTTGKTMSSVGSVTLRMAIGIYSGPCHFFLVDGTHRELVVTGPAATATIGLESQATAGQVLVSPQTASALEQAWLGPVRHGARLLRKDVGDDDVSAHLAAVESEPGDDLTQYVPEPLRAHLLLEAGEAEHRQVTAAFLEFSGVDELLATEGPEAVHARLETLAGLVGDEAAHLGLTWLESDIEHDGGKLYLVGGAPSSTGADEERMLRLLRTVLETFDGLPIQAGVNRGPAFCGDIGSDSRRTYAVIGDTVNLAARLMGRAERRGLLATADVLDRASTRFDTAPLPFLMKGKERPITAYQVGGAIGVKEEETQAELPFVGRDAELAALVFALGAARARQQQLIEIVGEPGIGKSRLVEELKTQALGFTQLISRCDAYQATTPYFVFAALLRPLAGITGDMPPADAGAHLAAWVSAVMPDLAPWLPLLAIPFGAEVAPTLEADQIAATHRREKLLEVVEQFLARILLTPTLIVIEDAHWIDDASRELLRHVTATAAPRPWLICVTQRPQADSLAREVGGHTQLQLAPLGPNAATALALSAAGDFALSADALTTLTARAGGNPLFLRELVVAVRSHTGGDLPDSVETLILSRMDTLAPEDRFLLRNASVLGGSFELDLLAEIVAEELPDVGDLSHWEELAEFVAWEGSGSLRFVHDLFRAVAYEGLSFRRRREIHARVGAALERRGGDHALLSLHFQTAGEHEKAWRYAVGAGRDAQARYANVDAAELYERALDAAAELQLTSDEVVSVAESLGDVCELAARYDAAEAAYSRSRSAIPKEDVLGHARLMWKEGVLRERLARYPDALRWYRRALNSLADVEAADAIAVELELAYAGAKHRQGRFREAVEWAGRAAEHAERAGLKAQLAHAFHLLDIGHTRLADGDHSFRGRALPIYEEIGDLLGQARVLNILGIDAYFDGRWDEAASYYRRCRDAAEGAGDVVVSATAINNEGEILSDQGRLEEARAAFDEALRVWRAAQYRVGVALATSNLGRVAARSGDFVTAYKLFADASAQFSEIGAGSLVLETTIREAECLVLEGRHKEAAAALRKLQADDGAGTAERAIVERLAGYAIVQSRAPFAKARPHFDAALDAARSADRQYELALTLRAIAETGGGDGSEAAALLEQLGVVSTPRVPLP